MQQAALKEKPGLLDVSRIAERIGMDFSDWPGNCYAVACQMLKCKMVKGRPAYGNYHGPVAPSSMFFGKKVVRHGWIERADGMIVDPTRWVFEGVEPYIYEGLPSMEYDEGANLLRARFARPAPIFDPNKQMVSVPKGEARELTLRADAANELFNNMLIDWINNGMEGDYSRKLDIALTALMPVLRANCRSAKAAAADR